MSTGHREGAVKGTISCSPANAKHLYNICTMLVMFCVYWEFALQKSKQKCFLIVTECGSCENGYPTDYGSMSVYVSLRLW